MGRAMHWHLDVKSFLKQNILCFRHPCTGTEQRYSLNFGFDLIFEYPTNKKKISQM